MATILNQEDKDKDKEKTLNMGGPQSTTTAPTVGNTTAPRGTSSGRFTNIQSYLNANRKGGTDLGTQVAGNIGGIGQQARNQLNTSRSQFDTQSLQGRLVRGQADVRGKAMLQNAGQEVYGNEQGTTENADKIKEFQRITSGQYLGPQGLQNMDAVRGKAQQASQLGQMAGSEGGRYALLRQLYNNPQYSRGQTKLDQLLLGQQTGQLNNARQIVAGLPQQLNTAVNEAQNRAKAYGAEAAMIGQETRDALGRETNLSEEQLAAKEAAAKAREEELRQAFARTEAGLNEFQAHGAGYTGGNTSGGTLTKADYDRLALANILGKENKFGDKNMTYGLNLANYLETVKSVDPTKESVAKYDEAARRNALARFGAQDNVLNFANIDKYRESTQKIKDTLAADIAREQAAYEQSKEQAGRYYNALKTMAPEDTVGTMGGGHILSGNVSSADLADRPDIQSTYNRLQQLGYDPNKLAVTKENVDLSRYGISDQALQNMYGTMQNARMNALRKMAGWNVGSVQELDAAAGQAAIPYYLRSTQLNVKE